MPWNGIGGVPWKEPAPGGGEAQPRDGHGGFPVKGPAAGGGVRAEGEGAVAASAVARRRVGGVITLGRGTSGAGRQQHHGGESGEASFHHASIRGEPRAGDAL